MDRKKLHQNQKIFPKNRQYPILNLYIMVTSFLLMIGQLLKIEYLGYFKSLPMLLMVKYIYNKNKGRYHLVAKLTYYALIIVLVTNVLNIFQDSLLTHHLVIILKIVSHSIFSLSLLIGENVRVLKVTFRYMRYFFYMMIGLVAYLVLKSFWHRIDPKLSFTIQLFIMTIQLCICLWRFEKTFNSSFFFSLYGTFMLYTSEVLNLLLQNIFVLGVIQLFYYLGHYLLMHGIIHQSNLQQDINRYIQIEKRNKNN